MLRAGYTPTGVPRFHFETARGGDAPWGFGHRGARDLPVSDLLVEYAQEGLRRDAAGGRELHDSPGGIFLAAGFDPGAW